MKTLRVEGVVEDVVTKALVEYREDLAKPQKKMEKKGLDTAESEEHDAAAKDALEQLGWKPEKKTGSRVEVVGGDTLPLPLVFGDAAAGAAPHHARVQCATCARHFIVPAGDALRACPDCGTVHRVKSDEDGTVHQRRQLIRPPADILALMVREQADDDDLTKVERTQLKNWREANPDHLTNDEHVEPGARVADPGTVGSGNPYFIGCGSLTGTECEGFQSTDTPGSAVCPTCGQKYVVEVVEGRVLVRSWTIDDEVDAQERQQQTDGDEQDDEEAAA